MPWSGASASSSWRSSLRAGRPAAAALADAEGAASAAGLAVPDDVAAVGRLSAFAERSGAPLAALLDAEADRLRRGRSPTRDAGPPPSASRLLVPLGTLVLPAFLLGRRPPHRACRPLLHTPRLVTRSGSGCTGRAPTPDEPADHLLSVRTRICRNELRDAPVHLRDGARSGEDGLDPQDESGAVTAEYAIATIAAVGLRRTSSSWCSRSDEVRGMLTDLIRHALALPA